MTMSEPINIFLKTTYLQSEEDRAINALFAVMQHAHDGLAGYLLTRLGIVLPTASPLLIREHVYYDSHSIVDGEIACGSAFVVALEAKIYKNQFDSDEQVSKYFRLLLEKDARKRLLVLVSTDDEQPTIVAEISGQTPDSSVHWIHWSGLCGWIRDYQQTVCRHPVDQFLVSQLLTYLRSLGLVPASGGRTANQRVRSQLKDILGNATAEKVLLHVFHFQGAHAAKIARDHNMNLSPVQRQLARLERSGLLRKERHGRTVVYYFNDQSPFLPPVLQLMQIVYDAIPLAEKQRVFSPSFRRQRG